MFLSSFCCFVSVAHLHCTGFWNGRYHSRQDDDHLTALSALYTVTVLTVLFLNKRMESELADLVCCDGRGRLSSKEDGGSSEAHSALPGDLEEENEPEDLQPMPAPIKELVDASLSEYLKIKFQAPWTLCTERPDYKIWNAPSPHKKDILYWKIEMTPVYGTREGITA